jgi:hypothetical protein
MRAFEIHTYHNGTWKIDSTFDDRDLALSEARRVDDGNRHAGVRVIEENHDESSNRTTTRTIFRGDTVDRRDKAPMGSQFARALGAGYRESGETGRDGKDRNLSSLLIPALILGGLVIAGLAALFGLHELSQLR